METFSASRVLLVALTLLLTLCEMAVARPYQCRRPEWLRRKRSIEIASWVPPESMNPCPSRIKIQTLSRFSDVSVKGLECDWDKIRCDSTINNICNQAYINFGKVKVLVACLPHRRVGKPGSPEFGSQSVIEDHPRRRRRSSHRPRSRRRGKTPETTQEATPEID